MGERVEGGRVYKNLRWQGQTLQLVFNHEPGLLQVQVFSEQPLTDTEQQSLAPLAAHLAGLQQNTAAFAEQFSQHPELGPLVQSSPHLFVAQLMPFEALCWAIIGQLISVPAALTIRRRFILAGAHEFLGLHAFPDHQLPLTLGVEGLRHLGLPERKAKALLAVAKKIDRTPSFLPLPSTSASPHRLNERLQSVPGVGPWTAQYTLLRSYNHLGADLSGDAAVRRALGHLLNCERPSADTTRAWLQQFSPYQALAAAHLWQWEQIRSL